MSDSPASVQKIPGLTVALTGIVLVLLVLLFLAVLAPRTSDARLVATLAAHLTAHAIKPSSVGVVEQPSAIPTFSPAPTVTPAPTSTFTPTPALAATPLNTSAPTFPTAISVIASSHAVCTTPMPVCVPVSCAVIPRLDAPPLRNAAYRNPITFRWRGSLNPGQVFYVTVDWCPDSGELAGQGVHIAQSGPLTGQSWTIDLPKIKVNKEWRDVVGVVCWTVSVLSGEDELSISRTASFYFDPLRGQPQAP